MQQIQIIMNEQQNVHIETLLASKRFQETKMTLPCALGVTDEGDAFLFNLTKAPHVIIGGMPNEWIGYTMHAIIMSLLQKNNPEELKLVLIDARGVEFTAYETLNSHYLARMPYLDLSNITNVGDAVDALNALCGLMQERYDLLRRYDARNIANYNDKYNKGEIPLQPAHGIMPYYVVMINELGDFMMTAGKEFELPLAMLAQLSRAVGIHIIVSSHRPLPRVFTGAIKANFPCRIAYKTMTEKDSRIITDFPGAEQLQGKSDLLFVWGGEPIHIHGAYVDEERDIPSLCTKLTQLYEQCPQAILPALNHKENGLEKNRMSIGEYIFQYADPLFEEVAKLIVENQSASTSLIQRRFCLGYNRVSRLLDMTESAGIVSSTKNDTYMRDVLVADTNELMHKLIDIKKKLFKEYERKMFI